MKQRVEEKAGSRALEFICQIFHHGTKERISFIGSPPFTGTSQVESQIMYDPNSSEVNRKSGKLEFDAHCMLGWVPGLGGL